MSPWYAGNAFRRRFEYEVETELGGPRCEHGERWSAVERHILDTAYCDGLTAIAAASQLEELWRKEEAALGLVTVG